MKINNAIDEALYKRQYKGDYTPGAEQKIMCIGGRVVATLQNIVCFTGLPKAGKSSFLSAAVASCFLPFSVFGINTILPNKRKSICYIDTESSEYDFYKGVDRVKNLLGRDEMPKQFHGFATRDLSPVEIKEYSEYYLSLHPEISVLYFDGLLDLLLNYNDEVESRLLINWLKRITAQYNILIVGVVHTGKKDNNTLGHFGSMVDRYCQSVLVVEKDQKKNTFELKPKFMRSDADFEPIVLANNNGTFTQINGAYSGTEKAPF